MSYPTGVSANFVLSGPLGVTAYVAFVRPDNFSWFNTSGTPAFETYNSGHWSDYTVALSTSGPLTYFTMPSGFPACEAVALLLQQAGGSPASTDTFIQDFSVYSDGTYWVPPSTIYT